MLLWVEDEYGTVLFPSVIYNSVPRIYFMLRYLSIMKLSIPLTSHFSLNSFILSADCKDITQFFCTLLYVSNFLAKSPLNFKTKQTFYIFVCTVRTSYSILIWLQLYRSYCRTNTYLFTVFHLFLYIKKYQPEEKILWRVTGEPSGFSGRLETPLERLV